MRFAVVVSRYNDFVTDRLQAGALAALGAAGVSGDDITIVRVPGAYEIPIAAQHAAESARFEVWFSGLDCPEHDITNSGRQHVLGADLNDTGPARL